MINNFIGMGVFSRKRVNRLIFFYDWENYFREVNFENG